MRFPGVGMPVRRSWLWGLVSSAEGVLTLLVTTAGALALGLLPSIAESALGADASVWWLVTIAAVAVFLCAAATQRLRSKPGVGIVIYLGNDARWDRVRLRAMQQDALRRHSTYFVVDPHSLLRDLPVSDHVALAYRVMQARLEETPAVAEFPEAVSFYVTARHQDAYYLGSLLHAQLHEEVRVMDERTVQPPAPRRAIVARLIGQSEERGKMMFPAVRLDSTLKRPPGPADLDRLRVFLDDPRQPPRWHPFPAPEGAAPPRRIALIVAMADNQGVTADALHAARWGHSEVYAFPQGAGARTAEARRCSGALVVRTLDGNLPDDAGHHEAFVRYVVHHWRRTVETESPEDDCWLFTDGTVPIVLALGALLGRRTALVPLIPRRPAAVPPEPADPFDPSSGRPS